MARGRECAHVLVCGWTEVERQTRTLAKGSAASHWSLWLEGGALSCLRRPLLLICVWCNMLRAIVVGAL
eukprot:3222338-Amphidinium_carterae.1